MAQIIIDNISCAAIVGRVYVDKRVEDVPSSISASVDGGGSTTALVTPNIPGGNTGYFSIPNPSPNDGRTHSVALRSGSSSGNATSPACSASQTVVAAATPIASPAMITAGGPVETVGAMKLGGIGAGTLLAIGAAVWYFFFRKRR